MIRLVVILGWWLVPACLWAGDWLGWRGPTGQGMTDDKNLPTIWSKEGKNLLWKVMLPGNAKGDRRDLNQSSPIIVKNRVIITACFGPKDKKQQKQFPNTTLLVMTLCRGPCFGMSSQSPDHGCSRTFAGAMRHQPPPATANDFMYYLAHLCLPLTIWRATFCGVPKLCPLILMWLLEPVLSSWVI